MKAQSLQASCAWLALMTAAPAYAQSKVQPAEPADEQQAQAAPAQDALSDIIVTAQRRSENLQTVNIAATAVSGNDLGGKAVVRQLDLQNIAPGLSIVKAGLTESVNIRGIGLASGSPQVANGVASYLDGIFQPPIVATGSFYDIASIEVLRGPQGTLVGSNSTGGAIFVNTNKPKLGERSAAINLEYGSYKHIGGNAAINLPISDTLAIRVAGLASTRDSYYNDVGVSGNKPDQLQEHDGRVQVLWKPGQFSAQYKAEFVDRDTGGYAYQPILTTTLSAFREPERYQVRYNTPTQNHEQAFINNLELKYETDGGLVLRALGGYQNKRINNLYDVDGTSAPVGGDSGQSQYVRERETSGEINIISPAGKPLSFIVGGYYQKNDINVRIFNYNTTTNLPSLWIESDTFKVTTGAFAQANYKLTSKLELQAGVRYSHYKVDSAGGVYVGRGTFGGVTGINVSPQTGHHTDGRLTGKVSLNWKPDDNNLFYVFVARGYKPGGLNPPTPPGLEFAPETVTDYELGWKGSFLDRHVRTQVGLFYNDYKNFQQSVLDTNSGSVGVANLTSAKIKGLEAQIQAKFGGLSFDGGVSYVDSNLGAGSFINTRLVPNFNPGGDLPQCAAGVAPGATCRNYTPYIQQTSGGAALYAPKWTWNVGAQYDIHVGENTLTPRLNYSYVGSQYTALFYNPVTDLLPARGLLSGQISYAVRNLKFEVYGTNLTKKYYAVGQSGNNEFYGAPREFGVRLGAKF